MRINYVKGDATAPIGPGPKVIAHICNDIGKWGRGFVLAVSRRWSQPEQAYRQNKSRVLGTVEFVSCEPGLVVANMVAQHGIMRAGSSPPIRYDALETALSLVSAYATETGSTVHMPRIGAGLAGGSWDKIESIIEKSIPNVQVTVYDL